MALEVSDTVSINETTSQLDITRIFRLPADEGSWPEQIRFAFSDKAFIRYGHGHSAKPAGNQQVISLRIPDDHGRDNQVRIDISLPAKRVGADWTLAFKSMLSGATLYKLHLDFGRPINPDSWNPSEFLKDAVLDDKARSFCFSRTNIGSGPLVLDVKASFHFSDSSYTLPVIEGMLSNMPVLNSLANKKDDAFRGYRMIILLHFLQDLVPFMHSLELRGLDPKNTLLLFKDYPYAYKDMVQATLHHRGYACEGPIGDANNDDLIRIISNFCERSQEPIVVIEDGGYVLPAFHRDAKLRPHLENLCGVVEQTTYGARRDLEVLSEEYDGNGDPRLGTALINVAQSEVKAVYEPLFVAEAACENVRPLVTELSWRATHVVILGYGAIGKAVSTHLQRNSAHVSVCDPSPLRLVLAEHDGAKFVDRTLGEMITRFEHQHSRVDYIIGTTGYTSVKREHFKALTKWRPNLISMSSKQVEFDLQGFADVASDSISLEIDGRETGTRYMLGEKEYIDVLANGYPINFFAASSVPNKKIDPIMGILHACAAELASPKVLVDSSQVVVGRRDSKYPALPWNRISSEIVEVIIEEAKIFDAMLPSVPDASGGTS